MGDDGGLTKPLLHESWLRHPFVRTNRKPLRKSERPDPVASFKPCMTLLSEARCPVSVRLNLCSMSHSYAQIEELLTLLKSLPAEQGAMTPGELEGYVTGLIVCPETIPLFEWQPPVWGDEGAVPFGGLWKAEVASRIVADHYNRISESLFYGSEQYVPLYEVDDESDEPLWEPWISGFERAMRLRPDAWERVVDSGETEAAASVNMILALYDIGQGQSDLAEEAIEEMDSIALDLIPGFVQTLYVRLASRQSGSNATTETEGEGAFGSNVILFPSRKAGRDARCP